MIHPTVAADELGAVLREGGAPAKRLREAYDYSQLWRYKTGRAKPDVDNAAKIQRLTDGRVKMIEWAATEPAVAS